MQAAAGAMAGLAGQKFADWTVTVADDFSYRDTTDGSIASDQGLRIVCGDDARAVLRLRSEEHTSELKSLMRISYAVFGLKKKNTGSFIAIQTDQLLYNTI